MAKKQTKKDQAQAASILKKKVSEVTPEELAQVDFPIGTASRPFPMWGIQRNPNSQHSDLMEYLSKIASDSNPMHIYSERPYEEVIALAYCDMPVPSMLPLFLEGLERRKPTSKNRAQFLIGDPGMGKSFQGAHQGRLRTEDKIEVLDCGGKNMRELLFEMVLDFGAGDPLPKAIDKRLKAHSLEALSMGQLAQLPDHVVEKDAKGVVTSVDWEKLKTEEVSNAFEILKKISIIEGLDKAGGNALGMNSQYGPLIQKWIAGEELTLDEYNKSREGTDDNLQTVWQFIVGEIDECKVENPLKNKDSTSGPSHFTFRREDMKLGFFVNLTGNKTEDGITTRSLNKSVYSRFSPDTLPDSQVIDWQHRICQMMVGLPVSTLFAAYQEHANKNPEAFGDWLMWLRQTKAKIDGVPMSELQVTLLSNWRNVVRASEKLALLFEDWEEMTNANKIIASGNADLVEEVDEEYSKKEGIDFRKIKQILELALTVRPHVLLPEESYGFDMGEWKKVPKLGEKIEEAASLHFGTRLAEVIERKIYEKSAAVGKEKLYKKLQQAMAACALRDITLQEGVHSQQKSVEEDLNISAFYDRDMKNQAKMAQKVFCEYLRQNNSDMRKTTDEEIVTVDKFVRALQAVAEQNTAETKTLFIVDSNPETLVASPLSSARIADMALYAMQDKARDFELEDLVHHDDLLASLALPTVSGKNLEAIWDNTMHLMMDDGGEAPAANDNSKTPDAQTPQIPTQNDNEGLHMAENRSKTGLATTTLYVRYQDGEMDRSVPVHIVRNKDRDKALVIGEKLSSKLVAAFQEANIVYIDRHDPSAKAKTEMAVADLTRGMQKEVQDRLVDAFNFRNEGAKLTKITGEKQRLADLLINDSIKPSYHKYLLKEGKKALRAK